MARQTRWLNDEEQRAWRAYLEANRLLFDAIGAQMQRDAELPHTYFEILVRLSEAPDRAMRMTDLAESTASSKSRLSHAVASLEKRGWVRRVTCATDGRGQLAQLTPKGFAALEEIAPNHVDCVRRSLFDALSPAQVKQLRVISEAMVSNLSKGAACD